MTTVVAGIPPRAPYRTARPHVSGREISVGLRSMGYLADHAVRDLVVLPGAFFLEVARATESEASGRRRHVLRNVVFESPIVVGSRDTTKKLRVARTERGDDGVEYAFVEVREGDRGTGGAGTHTAARLVVEHGQAPAPTEDTWSTDAFMALSPEVIDPERFYTTLRENGNQYGPHFQRLSSVWRAGDQALGELSAASPDRTTDPRAARVSVLDAAMQLLSVLAPNRGRPFMLRSIDSVVLTDDVLPGTLWAHATVEQKRGGHTDGAPFVGNVRVFDESGKLHADLRGIAFAFLDAVTDTDDTAATAPTTTIAIASNFTAEPVEDSMRFWADHFDVPLQLEFAPYNQVFQQLLDPRSAMRAERKHRDGVNVILLSLEEWATARQPMPAAFDMDRAKRSLGSRPRYALPNGLEVAHLNAYETDYVYHEVFQDECYLRHGIALRDGDTVVDIGANIGLFSLFVMSRCRDARIIAFEPAPVVCDLLKANCDAYGSNVEVVNAGVSGAPGEATFTFYERSSVFSGFHTDAAEDRRAVEAIVRNTLHSATSADDDAVERFVADLTEDRMRGTAHSCRMTSVSEIIRDRGLARIDLLKVDAERSELDILHGIEEPDWPKIEQVVLEIHDRTQKAVAAVEALLTAKGFHCAVESERLLENSGLFNLYATRRQPEGGRVRGTAHGAAHGDAHVSDANRTRAAAKKSLDRNVRDFCEALGTCMTESTVPMVLCVCPRTPAGETMRAELDAAEQSLLSAAGATPNVCAIGSQVALQRYPVSDPYDAHTHQLGHVPYTPACYAAIGSTVWRAVTALKRRPFKVIALDCDNVLWKGVCGEDGAFGIELTPAHVMLQRFMVDQVEAGMLVCLCSKNSEQDVLDVFDKRPDMVLKREHLVSWRINWNGKADNLVSLAQDLELGLDSFVFIDDNPVECAEVRSRCPGVLALQLPGSGDAFRSFFDHTWAFDRTAATGEDCKRTTLYQQGAERARFRDQAVSLQAFIDGLDLRVEVADATDDDIPRVAQLTERTNQFNFSTIRRSQAEIRDFMRRDGAACRVVRVSDRFGDYGLVGAVLFTTGPDRLTVDTFLLSCRVLGRGVEHSVLAAVGATAVARGKRAVELVFRPSPRNEPARSFLASLGGGAGGDAFGAEGSHTYVASDLAGLEYRAETADAAGDAPEDAAEVAAEDAAPAERGRAALQPDQESFAVDSNALREIAEQLTDTNRLMARIDAHRFARQPGDSTPETAAGDAVETSLRRIWCQVLGCARVAMHDNFFEIGGTSLKAVQVLALVKRELGHDLSIVSLFESPTVALMAAQLRATKNGGATGSADERVSAAASAQKAAAADRGRRRRVVSIRRES